MYTYISKTVAVNVEDYYCSRFESNLNRLPLMYTYISKTVAVNLEDYKTHIIIPQIEGKILLHILKGKYY